MRKEIPMEDFFRNPEKCLVEVSPTGQYLSWMEPWEHRLNIFVMDVKTNKIERVTTAKERSIYGYVWAGKDRIVYVMDKGGDENTRLYGINPDGSNPIDFTSFDNVKCDIVDELEEDDEHILFQMNKRNPEIFDIYRLNVMTGEMEAIAENPGNIRAWITDHNGKLRLAYTSDGVNTGLRYRETEERPWQQIANYDFKENIIPLFFSMDNEFLYVASNLGRDKRAIYEFDLKRAKLGKMIYEHNDVDVYRLLYSRKRKLITGVWFNIDKGAYHFFDKDRRKIQDFLEEKIPGYEVSLASHNLEETIWTVYACSDRSRGSYYLLDLNNLVLTKLFDLAPWLPEDELAEMKPIVYTARDGLKINGYLTLPVNTQPENLPVVINPHGGPWHRDSWGFNAEAQFLANRGYAVLQMNFRGSTDFGREFWVKSFKEWGLSMQDDITDGVHWLVEQGIADSKRIAIYGGSYGGYAALMGIVKTPVLYAAAVDYVGVSNMFTFLSSFPPYWKPMQEMMYEMTGHPEKDSELLKSVSPALHADRIKTPLLIAQGANDPRVKKQESDQMVDALKARGIEVEYIVKENEGHGFFNEENRFDFYRAMEAFLKKHIG
jgi:dipeptidyl aminopeptidase/acylaminoacyl peptidase